MQDFLLFEDGGFEDMARLSQERGGFGASFDGSRFDTMWSVRQPYLRDSSEQASSTHGQASAWSMPQIFFEGADQLKSGLKAQLARKNMAEKGRLSHHCPD